MLLVENDHPELDDSDLLDKKGVNQYQNLIGALQGIISIGRFDIQTAVMALSSFRSYPYFGHLHNNILNWNGTKKAPNSKTTIASSTG